MGLIYGFDLMDFVYGEVGLWFMHSVVGRLLEIAFMIYLNSEDLFTLGAYGRLQVISH
jgi:hypothetical protein